MGSNRQPDQEEIEMLQKACNYLGFLLLEDMTVHFVVSNTDE